MRDPTSDLARSYDLSTKVGQVLQRRVELAQERFNERIQGAYRRHLEEPWTRPISPWELFASWQEYATGLAQRSILFWETLGQRRSNYLAHDRAGKPPVLHFDYFHLDSGGDPFRLRLPLRKSVGGYSANAGSPSAAKDHRCANPGSCALAADRSLRRQRRQASRRHLDRLVGARGDARAA